MTTSYLSQVIKPVTEEISRVEGAYKPTNYVTSYRDFSAVKAGLVGVQITTPLSIATLIKSLPFGLPTLVEDEESLPVSKLIRGSVETYNQHDFGDGAIIKQHEIDAYSGAMIANGVLINEITKDRAKIALVTETLVHFQYRLIHQVGLFINGSLFGEATATNTKKEPVKVKFLSSALTPPSTYWSDPNSPIITFMSAVRATLMALPETERVDIKDCTTVMSTDIFLAVINNKEVQSLFSNLIGSTLNNLASMPDEEILKSPILRKYFGTIKIIDDSYIPTPNNIQRYTPKTALSINPPGSETQVYITQSTLDPRFTDRDGITGGSYYIDDALGKKDGNALDVPSITQGLRARILPVKRRTSYTIGGILA